MTKDRNFKVRVSQSKPFLSIAWLFLSATPASARTCNKGNNLLHQVAEWSTSVGATNSAPGGGGTSMGSISANGTSLTLSGNDDTTTWMYYYKEIDASPGESYIFSADVTVFEGTGPVGTQYNNAYIGLKILKEPDTTSNMLASEFVTPLQQGVPVPMIAVSGSPSADTTVAHVGVFLSMSGMLNADNLCLRKSDSFSVLVEHMDRYYSHFESCDVSWGDLTEKYRSTASAASDSSEFAEVVVNMLAELKDVHIGVVLDDKIWQPYKSPAFPLNFDPKFSAVRQKLQKPLVGSDQKSHVIGRFDKEPGLAYFLATTLLQAQEVSNSEFDATLLQFKAFLDNDEPDGLIVDLRANSGGDERRAQALASLLNSNPDGIIYARSKWRSGNNHTDFYETPPRILEQRSDGAPYTKPVVVISGRACASSCEAFIMMLRALPGVTVVGTNTLGASGNPAPVYLGNGVIVSYSRWVSMLPDRTSIERAGVPPDQLFETDKEVTENYDPTFEFAYSILRDMVGYGPNNEESSSYGISGKFVISLLLLVPWFTFLHS